MISSFLRKDEAVVIDSRDWKETSKIVTFYTLLRGKIIAVAKGARRDKSPLRDCLEILSYVSIVFYEREGREFKILSQCVQEKSLQALRENFEKMAYGSYFAQLVSEMVENEEANDQLFRLLLGSLYHLAGEKNPETLARFFELHLLRLLGYMPVLENCAACGKKLSADCRHESLKMGNNKSRFGFSASTGGIVCPNCISNLRDGLNISAAARSALLHLKNTGIGKLPRLRLSGALKNELKAVMGNYIRYFLGKELKSLDFLESVVISTDTYT